MEGSQWTVGFLAAFWASFFPLSEAAIQQQRCYACKGQTRGSGEVFIFFFFLFIFFFGCEHWD